MRKRALLVCVLAHAALLAAGCGSAPPLPSRRAAGAADSAPRPEPPAESGLAQPEPPAGEGSEDEGIAGSGNADEEPEAERLEKSLEGGAGFRVVRPAELEARRVSGDRAIAPDVADRLDIAESGKDRVSGVFKVCIASTGVPAVIERLRSTGFPGYDEKLVEAIMTWRFRPFLFHGKPEKVCSSATFEYRVPDERPPVPRDLRTARLVPHSLHDRQLAGSIWITLEVADQLAIERSGQQWITVSYELCIDPEARPTVGRLLKSSGFPGFDAKAKEQMGTWRFRPYVLNNGQPQTVCVAATLSNDARSLVRLRHVL